MYYQFFDPRINRWRYAIPSPDGRFCSVSTETTIGKMHDNLPEDAAECDPPAFYKRFLPEALQDCLAVERGEAKIVWGRGLGDGEGVMSPYVVRINES